MQQLQPNTTLQSGKYRIIRFLSSGGFGNTYEGVHTMMDTRVAIKEFFPKMFCDRDESTSHVTVTTQGNRELVSKLRDKFNKEAQAVFKMKHDNIVRVLDIFEENGTAYYVMEYIDGQSLHDVTKKRGALPEAEAVGYIRQVTDALKYVHTLNRLHLDIKPGNIMIDKNGKAILIDFGASKHYDMESGENTSTLMGLNTKGYAPIEQSTQSFNSFSPATDIYALGATLYKLLTGITPPDANLLLAEEETLQPLPNNISFSIRNAVMAAMQLRRKNRPQSVDIFMKLLDSKNNSVKGDDADDEGTTINEPVKPTQKKKDKKKTGKEKVREDEGVAVGPTPKPEEKSKKSPKGKFRFWIKLFLFAMCAFGVLSFLVAIGNQNETGETIENTNGNRVVNQTFKDSNDESFSYTGEVRNGLPNGMGEGVYSFGRYVGPYKDGLMHGADGKFTEKGGATFVGSFDNDYYSEGTLMRTDGTWFVGKMKNGAPFQGTEYYKDGKIKKQLK